MNGYSLPAEDLDHVLAETGHLWGALRGQRLFLTGGTGFFGVWLVETLLRANETLGLGASAVVLSRDPTAFLRRMPHLADRQELALHVGDVREFRFPAGEFSHVIHAASPSTGVVTVGDRLAQMDVHVRGTQHALEFARSCGARTFLLVSSGGVYGRQPPEVSHVSEDYLGGLDPMDALSGYGQSKRLAEHLAALCAEQYGIEAKIARCFAFVGPHLPLDAHYAIGNFIGDGLRGGPIRVRGDGAPRRSYLYAADLAIWLWTILFRGRSCRPYNVGSELALSIAELAHLVAAAFQPPPAVIIAGKPEAGKPAERYVPSVARAAAELSLRQGVDLQEAVRRTIHWHRLRREQTRLEADRVLPSHAG